MSRFCKIKKKKKTCVQIPNFRPSFATTENNKISRSVYMFSEPWLWSFWGICLGFFDFFLVLCLPQINLIRQTFLYKFKPYPRRDSSRKMSYCKLRCNPLLHSGTSQPVATVLMHTCWWLAKNAVRCCVDRQGKRRRTEGRTKARKARKKLTCLSSTIEKSRSKHILQFLLSVCYKSELYDH